MDCLHGFLLSAGIVFIFLGATSLRDYFRHLRELGGHDANDDRQERQGARAATRAVGPANRAQAVEGIGEDGVGAPGIAGAGQIIRRNAENVAARLEMQAARLEAHVEQIFDGLDDADGAEDVLFDELVGILVASSFSVVPIASRIWKDQFQLCWSSYSKDDSRKIASILFPSMSSFLKRKKDHGRAEALLCKTLIFVVDWKKDCHASSSCQPTGHSCG